VEYTVSARSRTVTVWWFSPQCSLYQEPAIPNAMRRKLGDTFRDVKIHTSKTYV